MSRLETFSRYWLIGIIAVVSVSLDTMVPLQAQDPSARFDPEVLSSRVTIYRDAFGMPHIDGADDVATIFGFAYAQAEDYFW